MRSRARNGRSAHLLELLYLFGEPLLRALALDGVARRVGEEPARCLHGGGGARHLGKNAVHFDACRVSNVVLSWDTQARSERAELARKGVEYAELVRGHFCTKRSR